MLNSDLKKFFQLQLRLSYLNGLALKGMIMRLPRNLFRFLFIMFFKIIILNLFQLFDCHWGSTHLKIHKLSPYRFYSLFYTDIRRGSLVKSFNSNQIFNHKAYLN